MIDPKISSVLSGQLHGTYGQMAGPGALRDLNGLLGDIMTLMLGGFEPSVGFGFWEKLSMPDAYLISFYGETFAGLERIRYGGED